MLNKNKKWIIFIDILMATAILSIFYLWLFQFLNFQYKFWDLLSKNNSFEILFQESKNVLKEFEYDKLDVWNYILYYEQNGIVSLNWSYILNKIQYDWEYYDWYKINNLWYKIDSSLSENSYSRIISIENIISPFSNSWINIKKITVSIKDKDCANDCFSKYFYIYKPLNYYE